MLIERGEFKIGIEYQKKVHRDFELRPLLVRDSVEILESVYAERAQKNDVFYGLCLLSKQIIRLGEIPKESITPELLMEMYDTDIGILHDAKGRLAERLKTFRREDKAQ